MEVNPQPSQRHDSDRFHQFLARQDAFVQRREKNRAARVKEMEASREQQWRTSCTFSPSTSARSRKQRWSASSRASSISSAGLPSRPSFQSVLQNLEYVRPSTRSVQQFNDIHDLQLKRRSTTRRSSGKLSHSSSLASFTPVTPSPSPQRRIHRSSLQDEELPFFAGRVDGETDPHKEVASDTWNGFTVPSSSSFVAASRVTLPRHAELDHGPEAWRKDASSVEARRLLNHWLDRLSNEVVLHQNHVGSDAPLLEGCVPRWILTSVAVRGLSDLLYLAADRLDGVPSCVSLDVSYLSTSLVFVLKHPSISSSFACPFTVKRDTSYIFFDDFECVYTWLRTTFHRLRGSANA